jgi:putative transposase
MNTLSYKAQYRRKLPHYQPIWAKLFITYRLADSLPDHVVAKLRQEQVQKEKELARIKDINERKHLQYEFQRRWFAKYDAYLDRAETGPKWLIDPGIAKLVYESIRYRDGKVYDLDCLTIMSNHVHQVIEPLAVAVGQVGNLSENVGQDGILPNGEEQIQNGQDTILPYSVSKIMHSLKRYTGRQANLILGREGQFWQHENYDHVVRDDKEFERIIWYILNNPVKAGLVDSWEKWEWSYCKYL